MALMLGDDETNNSMNELSSTPAMANNSFPPPIVDNASIPYSDNNSFPMPIVNDGSIPYPLQNHMSQDQFSLSEEANLRRLAYKAYIDREFQRQVSLGLVLLPEHYSYLLPARHDNSLLPILNNASTLPGVVFSTSMEPQGFDGDWAYMNSLNESAPSVELPPLPSVMPETFGDMWDEDDIPPFNDHMSMLCLPYAPMPDNSLLPIINDASTPLPGVVFSTSVEPQGFYDDWADTNSLAGDVSAPSVELPPLPNVMPETFLDMWDEDHIPPLKKVMSMFALFTWLHTSDNATVPST